MPLAPASLPCPTHILFSISFLPLIYLSLTNSPFSVFLLQIPPLILWIYTSLPSSYKEYLSPFLSFSRSSYPILYLESSSSSFSRLPPAYSPEFSLHLPRFLSSSRINHLLLNSSFSSPSSYPLTIASSSSASCPLSLLVCFSLSIYLIPEQSLLYVPARTSSSAPSSPDFTYLKGQLCEISIPKKRRDSMFEEADSCSG